MINKIKNLVVRSLTVKVEDKAVVQRARMLLFLLLVLSVGNVVAALQTLLLDFHVEYLIIHLLVMVALFVFYVYTRRGHRWPAYVLLFFLIVVIPYAFRENLNSPALLGFAVPIIMVPLVAAPWVAMVVAGLEMLSLLVARLFLASAPFDIMVFILIGLLGVVSWFSSAGLENAFKVVQARTAALSESNRALAENESLLKAQARDLEQRARYLQATSEVARETAEVLDLQLLFRRIVNLVSQRFGFYHAGIFMLDGSGQWAVLQAASSEGGQKMLARGHRLAVGSESMVGYVTEHGEPRIVLDVTNTLVFFDNPDLPETQSAVVLPLRVRNEIIGALDVQSKEVDAFNDEVVTVLQAMADQVALSISNVRLLMQARENLEAARRAYVTLGRTAWAELLQAQPDLGYRSTPRSTRNVASSPKPEVESAVLSGEIVEGHDAEDGGRMTLAVPVKASGQVIGVIDTYKPAESGDWTKEELVLLESLSEQLGLALESARLYRDSQRRAAREQMTREVAGSLQRATNMEGLLRTTVEELNRVLGASRAYVKLGTEAELLGKSES